MIVDFIKYLKEYECSTEPTSIKIIVGTKILDDDGQSIGGDFPIEIYRQFKHVAFFINKPKCVLRSAECRVFSLLFRLNEIDSKETLLLIKSEGLLYKLIFYLYYEHGIVLVNRVNHNALFKHFENINVTDVLITGSNSYKWILQSFNPNNTRVGIVEHPSLNNQIGDAVNIWDRFNNDRVQRYENFEKVLLDSFTAIKLQSAIIYEVSE